MDNNDRFIVSRTAVFHKQSNWSKIHLNEIVPKQCSESNEPEPQEQDVSVGEEKGENRPNLQKVVIKEWKSSHPEIKVDSLSQKEARYRHDGEVIPDRPSRATRNQLPKRFNDYIMHIQDTSITPNTYEEVLKLPPEERSRWEEAMDKEMDSLRELKVFTLAEVPEGRNTIGTRWIFKIKNQEGNKYLYKARLVAQGFAQRFPEDYTDTYSPTVRIESVKTALVVASVLGLEVHQFDVQTAYLHAKLDKEIYVKAPHSKSTNKGETWLLNKSLYGLKQSGKRWYECLVTVLTSMGFTATIADNCFFTKKGGDSPEYVLVYVDDILYISKNKNNCDNFARRLGQQFTLKYLGKINKYLGMDVCKTDRGFQLSQKEKIIELLHKCNMADAKGCDSPMQSDFLKICMASHLSLRITPYTDPS